jgi:NAD(P)-dependent dehydrogenase (short-subunit alcohol dehydrogenase family)
MMTVMPEKMLQSQIEGGPLKRLAAPAEIANVITFLASEQSSWVTGATVDANGGTLML